MSRQRLVPAFAFFAMIPGAAASGEDVPPGWTEVSAIFNEHCVMCHSAVAGASKGLRLDDYTAALTGGDRGVVLVPGNAADSELIRRLRGQSVPRMPFLSRPLPDAQIALIENWIAAGLPKAGESQ